MRRIVVTVLAVLAAMSLTVPSASAASPVFISDLGKYGPVEFWNEPAKARSGGDGHCYKASNAFHCTVDTTNDVRKLYLPRLAGGYFDGGGGVKGYLDPIFPGQLPYCRPQWFMVRSAYHADGTSRNSYFCAFWTR